jgi:MEDS: MEthanogen/methylotroph, DcmR Sensory domain
MPGARPSADLQAPIDFERPTADAFGAAGCPHMAILLDSTDDVAPALASFYNLGLRRNAWLFHRSLPGKADEDRQALSAAGLDVEPLEQSGRLEVCELPIADPPETWAQPWVPVVDRRLAEGYDAVWWSRFPFGGDDAQFERAMLYDRYWDDCFRGRSAVSLCVYIVGDLPQESRDQRAAHLHEMHDATLTLERDRRLSSQPRRQ